MKQGINVEVIFHTEFPANGYFVVLWLSQSGFCAILEKRNG